MRFSPVVLLLAGVLFFGTAVGDYFSVPTAAAAIEQPSKIRIEVWQDADSARYVVSWVASRVGPRQKPIDVYQTRIVAWNTPQPRDTLAAGQTPETIDTLAVAYPPLDSTVSLRALVRAVDSDGDVSPWMMSLIFDLTTRKLPPSPPDSVQAVEDTLGAIAELHLRPSVVELFATDSAYADSTDFLTLVAENRAVLFCAFAVRHDGSTGITHPGSTGQLSRDEGDIEMADYISSRCWELYRRWQLEVKA